MRAIWKGTISFSLVNIPISLYPATRREELKFHLLRKSDLSPISYRRVAQADEKEVPWEQIVKGYEYEKGQYIVLDPEDFKRADVEATQSIDIREFVKLEDIDPIFYDAPYYLEPQKRGAKAYALLREALQRTGRVGIAKVVIKTRQHLAAVKPEKKALVLELMHFAEELTDPGSLEIPGDLDLGKREQEMACELVERMSDRWQPSKYTDDYRHALMDLIQKKIESGGRTPAAAHPHKREPSKVIDLVSILQQSLKQAGSGAAPKKASRAHKQKKELKKAA
ncbi:MAG: Ku protein [Verrucomicrobia bacterium]|nr:MAG: Ku protein [Verrucomicrobiota bacterium]